MRIRSIVLGATAGMLAGAIAITSLTGSSGDAASEAAAPRATVAPNWGATAEPSLQGVLESARDTTVDPKAAHDALLAALERDPVGTLAVLQRFLADADPRDPAARTVVGALVAVGTPEIQESLVQLVERRSEDTEFVKLVVPTLGFLPKPTVATEHAVRALAADTAPAATQINAHLTLGVMASRFDGSDAPRGTAIVDEYAGKLAAATTPEDRKRWLSVLGNAGTPGAAAAIEAQLDAEDPMLRSQALEAMRRVASPDADARLVRALDDRDPRVRTSAAWSLSYRQATPETLRTLLGKLAAEADEKAAMQLLEVVWPRRKADLNAVLATVRAIADGHPVAAVRTRAKTLLDAKA